MPIIFEVPPLPPSPMPYPPGTILATPNGSLGLLPLNQVDEYGVEWLWSDIEGWDSPEAATQITQRTGQDGAWSGKELLAPRTLTLSGAAWCDDPVKMRDAADRFFAAITKTPFTLTIDEHGLVRYVTVQRQGAPTWDYISSTGATWSVQLISIDPRKYSNTQSSVTVYLGAISGGWTIPFTVPFSIDAVVTTDTVQATNAGNQDAPLHILFHGPVQSPILSQPELDKQVKINLTLDADEYVEINTETHSVVLNGSASRVAAFEGDWLYLPPGTYDLRFLAASYDPSAYATITWRSTWL